MAEYIGVGIVSQDSYFIFGAKALIGRDRYTQIYGKAAASLHHLQEQIQKLSLNLQIILCDLDSIDIDSFCTDLISFRDNLKKDVKFICLAEGIRAFEALANYEIRNLPIQAILAKSDIGYFLHVAINTVHNNEYFLLSDKSSQYLISSVQFNSQPQIVKGLSSSTHHHLFHELRDRLSLSQERLDRMVEITYRRIFIGSDNSDIADEFCIAEATVRREISEVWEEFKLKNETDKEWKLFKALSDWSQETMFNFE